jgi:hypothetical protein
MVLFNLTFLLIFWNYSQTIYFGFQDSIPLDNIETWLDIIHPEDRKMMEEYLQECILNQNLFRKEYRIIRKTMEKFDVDGWGEIILMMKQTNFR